MVVIDDGSMNKVDREKALEMIKNKAYIRVILISFKAGSTGNDILSSAEKDRCAEQSSR